MADYKSKYTGTEIDTLLGKVNSKQDKLIAGNGIIIAEDGKTISSTGGGSGGGYNPPADGIPKSDLSIEVQNSLNKADTALQKHQDISGKQNKIESTNFGSAIKSNGISIIFKTDNNNNVRIANIMLADDNNIVGLVTNTERKSISDITNKLNKPKKYAPSNMPENWEDNTYYTLENDVVSLNIPAQAISNSINGILVFFHTATNFSSISYPNNTIWIGIDAPKVEADKYYLLSILNGYCSINEVSFQNPS